MEYPPWRSSDFSKIFRLQKGRKFNFNSILQKNSNFREVPQSSVYGAIRLPFAYVIHPSGFHKVFQMSMNGLRSLKNSGIWNFNRRFHRKAIVVSLDFLMAPRILSSHFFFPFISNYFSERIIHVYIHVYDEFSIFKKVFRFWGTSVLCYCQFLSTKMKIPGMLDPLSVCFCSLSEEPSDWVGERARRSRKTRTMSAQRTWKSITPHSRVQWTRGKMSRCSARTAAAANRGVKLPSPSRLSLSPPFKFLFRNVKHKRKTSKNVPFELDFVAE